MHENDEHELAESQGGSTMEAHAQRTTDNIFDRLEQMGNATITSDTLLQDSLQSISTTLNTLRNEVNELKRKQNRGQELPSRTKKQRLTTASQFISSDSSDSDSEDELKQILNQTVEATDRDEWSDLRDFFQNVDETGDPIHEDLASVANKALRSKSKPEKTKQMQEKHKRPNNVENLQIPKIDEQLWKQLKRDTKSYDFAMQKCQQGMCMAMVPTLKALEILTQPQPEIAAVKESVGDIFKCLAQTIVQSNENRMEKIKKDLLPTFRPLCENTPSATNLFGDKLNENIKQLKENKTNLTSPVKRPFLAKRGGGPSYNRNQQINNYQHSAPTAYPPRTNRQYTGRPSGKKMQKNMKKIIPVSEKICVCFKNTPNNFKAGKTKEYIHAWESITSDKWILNTIRGCEITLNKIPMQYRIPKPLNFTVDECDKIRQELSRFLNCGIIEIATDDIENEFISNIFIRPKKDGRIRIILNLKHFNTNYVDKSHFKMETLQSALCFMRKNCYLASVDLSDAFYSISIRECDRKYFRFYFDGIKYQFTALVMGYSCSPKIWTKVLKPVFAHLRALGHVSVYFIDDSCLKGDTYDTCLKNVLDTVKLMDSLGLTINESKSVLIPRKRLVFLGFVLCSETMTVRLTEEKQNEIKQICSELLHRKRVTIREFAKLIGKLTAASPGVRYASLYIRPLEKVKEKQLKLQFGNFDSFMSIPSTLNTTIQWWVENIQKSYNDITVTNPTINIYTDASLKMYGVYDETNNLGTQGYWSIDEQKMHINVLELKACEIGIKTFCKNITDKHVRIHTDNTTSCTYLNRLGGKIKNLDCIAREIWFWCIERKIHLSACHVPGVANVHADRLSRTGNDDLEWSLNEIVFQKLKLNFPQLEIDLFASNLNTKLPKYVSRYPDQNAYAVDAFTLPWNKCLYYMFPPFSLLSRILQKIEEDKTETILIAPLWTTQSWWPILTDLINGPCYLLPKSQEILSLAHKPGLKHPLTKMKLVAFRISGKPYESVEYRNKQVQSSLNRGEWAHVNNTTRILENGFFIVKERQIPLHQISTIS